jgi:hypothetical protein
MARIIGLVAYMIVLLSVGIVCLFFAEDFQRYAIRNAEKGPISNIEPIKGLIGSRTGRLSIKATGIGAILMFCLLLWALIASR